MHGVGGLQKVLGLRLRRPIAEHFIQVATEIGIPFNEDYNGSRQEGGRLFSTDRVLRFSLVVKA
ncbi:MAG: choline dehydrogenase [Planctomycetota bacterium]|jgi:choline dehydrogenase